ncbi:MAG: hypothetical protein ACI4XW_07320 [Candidatus Spyradocola sp.]
MNQPRKPGNTLLCGIVLTVVGAVLQLPAHMIGCTGVEDFLAGLLLGVSVSTMLVGVFLIGRSVAK